MYVCKSCQNDFSVNGNRAEPQYCPFCATEEISFSHEYEHYDLSIDPNGELPEELDFNK